MQTKKINYTDSLCIPSERIPKTVLFFLCSESHIKSGHNITLKSGLRELETNMMALNVLEHFFKIKQNSKIYTGNSQHMPSGDGNSALILTLVDQTEYVKRELSHKNNAISYLVKNDKPLLICNFT